MKTKYRIYKTIASFMIITLIVGPLSDLTGGPTQPEFSSFEPVGNTKMVDEFTGDFTYNLPVLTIPGAAGGGYSLSLSYHSGTSPQGEASWVGYGWTLNPGAIVRNKRGFPDDAKGTTVRYWNKTPKVWTVSAGPIVGAEAFGVEKLELTGTEGGINYRQMISYNNFTGIRKQSTLGFNAGIKGLGSLNFSIDQDNETSFGVVVSPGNELMKFSLTAPISASETPEINFSTNLFGTKRGMQYLNPSVSFMGSRYGLFSPNEVIYPVHMSKTKGHSMNYAASLQGNPLPLPVGIVGGIQGNYNERENITPTDIKTYGYMYSYYALHEADNDSDGKMMDYYSEKLNPFKKNDEFLAIPFSNADQFMATGEGLSGGFRLHSKKPGHYYPNSIESNQPIGQEALDIDLGWGSFGVGGNAGLGENTFRVGKWMPTNADDYQYPDVASTLR